MVTGDQWRWNAAHHAIVDSFLVAKKGSQEHFTNRKTITRAGAEALASMFMAHPQLTEKVQHLRWDEIVDKVRRK